ncbi:Cytidylate kinase [Ceratobasidium theobromae]|uniref:Uridylate kinase n=1 Tax=Ceratobasidium theobromae TaxID=1582974 RepID=A0A5N5QVK1_9AGAM|nr:Cytidylate kinase [Ceratobasidium theobromae]
MGLVEKVMEKLHPHKDKKEGDAPTSSTDTPATPAFDSNKVMVIYVLGGPGAGKGTQCAEIVRDFGFVHLSAGDLLREEQKREGSQFGALISEHIRNGTIVPMEVTVKLLENAIRAELEKSHPGAAWENGHGRFLVDGFPRKMDQAIKFDETVGLAGVCMSTFVLFFDTTEEVMLKRILERGKTSGREDDNEESIKKRFRTFQETSMPVVDKYRAENKVVIIDSTRAIDVVHADVQKVLREEFAKRGLPEK